MSECKTDSSCEAENSCGHGRSQQQEEGCTMAEDLLCLAESARHDLLKEKMKNLLETKIGKKLDQVAEIAVDAVLASMQHSMAQKQACEQYKGNLMAVFKG